MTDAVDIRASARFVPMSPQKVRRVIDTVRGLDAVDALEVLQFTPNAAARPVYKVVRSAVANAEENFGFAREELYVHKIVADKAPTRRWRRFGARGRFKPLKRRHSHISVVLRAREPLPES